MSQNDSLFRSAPIGSRIANHLIQIWTSERVCMMFLSPPGIKVIQQRQGCIDQKGGNPPRQISPWLLVKWESAAAEITKSWIGSLRRVRASELVLDALSALQNCIMVILNLYDKLFCNHVRKKQYFSKYAHFFWLRALTERTLFSEAMWTTQKKPQQTWVNSFVLIIYSQYNVKLAEWWEK